MALRPLSFGVRLREKDRSVTLRKSQKTRGWVVEDDRPRGGKQRRDHPSLAGAFGDLARSWRSRLQ